MKRWYVVKEAFLNAAVVRWWIFVILSTIAILALKIYFKDYLYWVGLNISFYEDSLVSLKYKCDFQRYLQNIFISESGFYHLLLRHVLALPMNYYYNKDTLFTFFFFSSEFCCFYKCFLLPSTIIPLIRVFDSLPIWGGGW